MLEQAFEALKTYDWGVDKKVLKPIDEQVVATHGDEAARADLEAKLAAVLKSDVPRDAKDYVCRKLMVIGTAACVPTLAEQLPNPEMSHMARYALERIPAPAAAKALRDALPKVDNSLKIGVISSLGVRQDADSVPLLQGLLADDDADVARAAAYGLGAIRSAAAATALANGKPSDAVKPAVADASLACAETLLADGKNAEALAIYKGLVSNPAKHVKLAATRGMLACAG